MEKPSGLAHRSWGSAVVPAGARSTSASGLRGCDGAPTEGETSKPQCCCAKARAQQLQRFWTRSRLSSPAALYAPSPRIRNASLHACHRQCQYAVSDSGILSPCEFICTFATRLGDSWPHMPTCLHPHPALQGSILGCYIARNATRCEMQ